MSAAAFLVAHPASSSGPSVAAILIRITQAGDARLTDTRADEQERGITIKSTGTALYYEISDLVCFCMPHVQACAAAYNA